ncbi:MAG: class I SAM-dependent methyltransferase [Trueperaceae bacterium]|nr:MAG: class I SAM-dependent methyltransferase [Trueperaceae bacterium]
MRRAPPCRRRRCRRRRRRARSRRRPSPPGRTYAYAPSSRIASRPSGTGTSSRRSSRRGWAWTSEAPSWTSAAAPGGLTIPLARALPAATVVGIDLDEGALEQARSLAVTAGVTNVSFCVGDATALPVADGEADATTCQTLLTHVADAVAVLREMIRATRPGARSWWSSTTTVGPSRVPTMCPPRCRSRNGCGASRWRSATRRGSVSWAMATNGSVRACRCCCRTSAAPSRTFGSSIAPGERCPRTSIRASASAWRRCGRCWLHLPRPLGLGPRPVTALGGRPTPMSIDSGALWTRTPGGATCSRCSTAEGTVTSAPSSGS